MKMKIFSFRNISIFILLTCFFVFFISIKLFFLSECYTTKIFSAYKSFGYNNIKQCYSILNKIFFFDMNKLQKHDNFFLMTLPYSTNFTLYECIFQKDKAKRTK